VNQTIISHQWVADHLVTVASANLQGAMRQRALDLISRFERADWRPDIFEDIAAPAGVVIVDGTMTVNADKPGLTVIDVLDKYLIDIAA
jgi:hypothetical protein